MRRRRGWVMIELIVVLALISTLGAMLYAVARSAHRAHANESVRIALDLAVQRVLARMTEDLRDASASGLSIDGGSLEFARNTGFDRDLGAPAFGVRVRYRRVEGAVERTETLPGRPPGVTRLCRDVPEGGLAFRREGGVLTIELTLERTDLNGTPVRRRAVTAVAPRNP